jgi:RimJ/RimL family protein N-acetyltransferase
MEIRTERLLLRRPRRADLDAVVAACRDPEIPRFIPFMPEPYEHEHAVQWLRAVDDAWERGGECTFALEERGVFAGVVTVRARDGGTVGYWLAPAARGRGLMAEAVRAVVDWARDEHGITLLRLTTHPDNAASQRVAERACFTRAGTIRQEPPFSDGTTTRALFEWRG